MTNIAEAVNNRFSADIADDLPQGFPYLDPASPGDTRRSEQILAHFHTKLDQDGVPKSLVETEFKAFFREANTTFSGQSPERRWSKCVSKRKRKHRNLLRVVSLGLVLGVCNNCGEQCSAMLQTDRDAD